MKNKKLLKEIEENFIFDYTSFFDENGKTVVKYENWCGEFDENGKLINKFICEDLVCCEDCNYITIAGKGHIIDKSGNFIIPPKYDGIGKFKENLWRVSKDGKYGLIDDNENILLEIAYDSMKNLYFADEKFIVSKGGKYGIMDIQKNVVVPFLYENLETRCCVDNVLYATKNGKCGTIDIENNVIIPFEYEELSYLGENNLCAKISKDKFIIINKQNEQICKTIFKEISPSCFNEFEDVQVYPAKIGDLYGFIDEFGNVKIDFKYQYTGAFSNGYCAVVAEDNEGYLIDINDNIIISDFCYDLWIETIDKDRIIVTNFEGNTGIIDNKNNKITDFIFNSITSLTSLNEKYFSANYSGKYGFIDRNGKPLKIDKESLKILETKLNIKNLPYVDQMKYLFS